MNLVPFPRVRPLGILTSLRVSDTIIQLHFLIPSYAPLYDPKAKAYMRLNVKDLTNA